METLPKSECNEKWKQTGHKKSTKIDQNSRTTICTHKTKHETPRIHNNRNKKHKHRIQTIYNRTQPKKNIQRNKHKKQLKIRKNIKNQKTQNSIKNLRHILKKEADS